MSSSVNEPCVPISKLYNCSYPDDEGSNSEAFYFETDHEALRNNGDYSALLRSLSILEAQKAQAIKDAEDLFAAQKRALQDPLSLVRKLQSGEKWPNIPGKQEIAEIPNIQWENYKVNPSLFVKKPETRNGAFRGQASNLTRESLEGLGCKVEKTSGGQLLVRGRLFDEHKPKTFNQPWTNEEQKRLEELLVEYPSEDVEMERWKKIANALGNRTPIQVQSRIQKYFLKLHKAGLPVPGRLTKSKIRFYKQSSRFQRRGVPKNSTFFPDVNPVVKMKAEDEERECEAFPRRFEEEIEEEEEDEEEIVDDVTKTSSAYKELLWLKKVRKELETELREGPESHLGYRCDGCNTEPITGCRWHCMSCTEVDVDFCNKCVSKGLSISPHHNDNHKIKPIRKKKDGFFDKDYTTNSGRLNYLDTNFMR